MKKDVLTDEIKSINCYEQADDYYILFTDNKEIALYPCVYNYPAYEEQIMIVIDVSYMASHEKIDVLFNLLCKIKDLPKCSFLNACRYRGSVYKEVYENGVCKEVHYFGKIDDNDVKEMIQFDIAEFHAVERT